MVPLECFCSFLNSVEEFVALWSTQLVQSLHVSGRATVILMGSGDAEGHAVPIHGSQHILLHSLTTVSRSSLFDVKNMVVVAVSKHGDITLFEAAVDKESTLSFTGWAGGLIATVGVYRSTRARVYSSFFGTTRNQHAFYLHRQGFFVAVRSRMRIGESLLRAAPGASTLI